MSYNEELSTRPEQSKAEPVDLQEYIHDQFTDNTIILVGNAPFFENKSQLIDSHDIVIRFNFFRSPSFEHGFCGRRMDYWVVNLDSGRKANPKVKARRATLVQYCQKTRSEYPQTFLMTPNAEDRRKRLGDALAFYASNGLTLIHADENLPVPLTEEPSVGFYMSCRILQAGTPFSMIGFTGKVNAKHHDGEEEMRFWRSHSLITFHQMAVE
jgi:hypothetical protein